MLRLAFAFLLLIHGLVHLMGFVKGFKYAEISQLVQPISKSAGAAWLMAALFFTGAAVLFLLKKDSWWMIAALAVVWSQILLFNNWQDAKFGTILNAIALVGIVLGYGNWSFQSMIQRELKAFQTASVPGKMLRPEMLAPLPPVVRAWLEHSNVIGKEIVQTVHLQQTGQMKTKPDGSWIPFEAEQYFTVNPPGFLWTTNIQAAPMIHIAGRDKYEDGHGSMLIKLLSLYPLADAKGPETDQGTLLRYLAETCWFPSAALSEYIQWEPIDSLSARATMRYGGVTASGIFRFNADGDLQSFEAKRYYDRKEGATLENWQIQNHAWKDMNDIRIAYKSDVTWKLEAGDYTWLKLELNAIEYNVKSIPGH